MNCKLMMSNDIQPILSKETLLNGYELRFSLKDSILLIEAKQTSSSKLYSVIISQSETEILTRELFSDIESLYHSLIEGVNNTNSSIKVTMSGDANLNYSIQTILLNKIKKFEFWIALKQVELDPIKINPKNVEKLKDLIHQKDLKISQRQQQNYKLINRHSYQNHYELESATEMQTQISESKIASEVENQIRIGIESALQKHILLIESKISSEIEKQTQMINTRLLSVIENQLEIGKQTQTIKKLLSNNFNTKTWLVSELKHQCIASENFLPPQINNQNNNNNQTLVHFDDKSSNSKEFIYSNNNHTITLKSTCWRMICLNKPLPKNYISFNFRIEISKSNCIMIGICPFSILNNTGACYNTMGAYAYYGHSGEIYYNNTSLYSKGYVKFKVGSIIRMTVNLLEYTIEWMQDNKTIHRMNLDKSYVNQEMFPCLHLADQYDSVSLLNN